MINESQPAGLNVSSYTVEEVETITSEYIMKNAVSMVTKVYTVYRKCFLELEFSGILSFYKVGSGTEPIT